VSLLMVSTVRYDTLPKPTPRSIRRDPLKFIVLALAIVATVVFGGRAIFPAMALYLVYGMIRQVIFNVRNREDQDDDTMEEAEPTPFDL
jgi:hypothetical protein